MPRRPPEPLEPEAIEVHPATGERWPDVLALFESAGNADAGCWCQPWRRADGPRDQRHPGSRRERLRGDVEEADPPPGMLAYVDGQPVGWIGFGRRPDLPRLANSHTIPTVDDVPVWSIGCFLIRTGYRRRGVSRALLDGLISYARARGAPALEAYPIDPAGDRVDVSFSFVGLTPVFERAGFRRIVETAATSARRTRWLMRLDLEGTPRARG